MCGLKRVDDLDAQRQYRLDIERPAADAVRQ